MSLQIDLYPETAALFIPCKSVELPIIKLNCQICKISHFKFRKCFGASLFLYARLPEEYYTYFTEYLQFFTPYPKKLRTQSGKAKRETGKPGFPSLCNYYQPLCRALNV